MLLRRRSAVALSTRSAWLVDVNAVALRQIPGSIVPGGPPPSTWISTRRAQRPLRVRLQALAAPLD